MGAKHKILKLKNRIIEIEFGLLNIDCYFEMNLISTLRKAVVDLVDEGPSLETGTLAFKYTYFVLFLKHLFSWQILTIFTFRRRSQRRCINSNNKLGHYGDRSDLRRVNKLRTWVRVLQKFRLYSRAVYLGPNFQSNYSRDQMFYEKCAQV